MSRLVIIGASAMGREVCAYAWDLGITVKGFIDSRLDVLDSYDGYPPILSSSEDYRIEADDSFVCAVGDPAQRHCYVKRTLEMGGTFLSLIHPTAYVGKNVAIGSGCIIAPNATLTADIQIGNHVIVNVNASISHDCVVGDYATLSPGCHVAGWCNLGKETFLGTHSALIPHITTGDGVFVAAGAVVTKSIGSGRVMGVPARLK